MWDLKEEHMSGNREVATVGGGCFWCLEAVFEPLAGVEKVVSGYAGGDVKNPSYREVCGGRTGHAEVVQVTFDPARLSYRDLLEIFFAFHDPTTLNRQGPDTGTQYRSAIYTQSPDQERVARELVAELTNERVFPNPIVTEIAPLTAFYAAEDYHQGYFRNNPGQPYCQVMIGPKVAKLRAKYGDRLKAEAAGR
jgi:peptide-methionine (S)-S-oxide reductase